MTSEEQADHPRFVFSGRTFVYMLPCRDEDILKFGFSRDPLQRLQALHRRFFDFFDLDRALLIDVEKLRDARRIERLMIQRFSEHRAPAPLTVREAAAGKTEWFRGVAAQGEVFAREIAASEGWIVHAPLAGWLRQRFGERSDVIYDWSLRMLESIEYEQFNLPSEARQGRLEQTLRRFLDTCVAVDVDVGEWVPPAVVAWYRNGGFH